MRIFLGCIIRPQAPPWGDDRFAGGGKTIVSQLFFPDNDTHSIVIQADLSDSQQAVWIGVEKNFFISEALFL